MKKINLFLLCSALSYVCDATIYYVNPFGNDATGKGTQAAPWKTLYKATSTVSGIGDVIKLQSGTYTETQQCSLAQGVSIEGVDTLTTILQSTLTADWQAIVIAKSTSEGSDGNQHITGVKFDGKNLATAQAIDMRGRKNFSIYNCSFSNFRQMGVVYTGRVDNVDGAPMVYATGNSFHDNSMNNCATYNGYGLGCLNIGGQDGLLIFNNSISQLGRAEGANGWPIKYYNGGWVKGCKIYNNTINKQPLKVPDEKNNWDFAIELFNEQGLEIYGNTIVGGGIDCNYQTKGIYAFSVWIHDNNISMITAGIYRQHAVILEFNTDGAVVENNKVDKMNFGVIFTPRSNDAVTNITIRNNLITNMRSGQGSGFFVQCGGEGQTNYFNNIDILNNTMVQDANNPTPWGIKMPDCKAGYIKNIRIRNNIIMNAASGAIVQPAGTVTMDSINIDNNNIFGNGAGNKPVWNGNAPTNYTFNNNLSITPGFVTGGFALAISSPLKGAGVGGTNIGYSSAGSIIVNPPPPNTKTVLYTIKFYSDSTFIKE